MQAGLDVPSFQHRMSHSWLNFASSLHDPFWVTKGCNHVVAIVQDCKASILICSQAELALHPQRDSSYQTKGIRIPKAFGKSSHWSISVMQDLSQRQHLAMIKCSICSYQCDNWYVSNWRLACHSAEYLYVSLTWTAGILEICCSLRGKKIVSTPTCGDLRYLATNSKSVDML